MGSFWAPAAAASSAPTSALVQARWGASWGRCGPADSSTNLAKDGLFEFGTDLSDASSAEGTDGIGKWLSQSTSTVDNNSAYSRDSTSNLQLLPAALPWLSGLFSFDSVSDISVGLGFADSSVPNNVVTSDGQAGGCVNLIYSTETSDTNLYVSHDVTGGTSRTRVDTGVARAKATYPNVVLFELEWTSSTAVTWRLFDAADVSVELASGSITTDLPTSAFGWAYSTRTRTTTAKTHYLYNVTVGTAASGPPS